MKNEITMDLPIPVSRFMVLFMKGTVIFSYVFFILGLAWFAGVIFFFDPNPKAFLPNYQRSLVTQEQSKPDDTVIQNGVTDLEQADLEQKEAGTVSQNM